MRGPVVRIDAGHFLALLEFAVEASDGVSTVQLCVVYLSIGLHFARFS